MDIYVAMQYCSRCVVDTERGKVRDGEIDFLRENAKHVDTKSSHIILRGGAAAKPIMIWLVFKSFVAVHRSGRIMCFRSSSFCCTCWSYGKNPPMYNKSELALYMY